MYKEFLDKLKPRLEKTIDQFKEEIGNIRTGRATPALLDGIEVTAYNTKTPLNQLAAIQSPDPRTLLVQPWDKNIIKEVQKAIEESPLSLAPVLDGEVLRISIPALNEEKRKELVRLLKEKMEEARIKIRQERERILDEAKKMEKESEITEDDKFLTKEKVQELVDQFNKKIEEISEKKEKDIMTV